MTTTSKIIDHMDKEPYKSRTIILVDGVIVNTYSQCYEFSNESKAEFFKSSKLKESETLKVETFSIKSGKKGDKKLKHFVIIHTPRID